MSASIIILTYNNLDLTRACLDSVKQYTDLAENEVIIIDNNSTDGTRDFLGTVDDKFKVILNDDNRGFSKGCNQGAAQAQNDTLVFLNNDTHVLPNWLRFLTETLEEPGVGMAGAKLLFKDNTIQHAGVVFLGNNLPYHIYAGFPSNYPQANIKREFQCVTAACCAVKRAVFEQAGGFDEAFINGYEDVDLCLRIRQQGHKIVYSHRAMAYHDEGVSENRLEHMKHNTRTFKEKWGHTLFWDDYKYYLQDRALDKDNPEGIHIVMHHTEAIGLPLLLNQIYNFFMFIQENFRFTILSAIDDDDLSRLDRLFGDALEVITFAGSDLGMAFQTCVEACAAKAVLLIETDKIFSGRNKTCELFEAATAEPDLVIQIPFTDKKLSKEYAQEKFRQTDHLTEKTLFLSRQAALAVQDNLKTVNSLNYQVLPVSLEVEGLL